MNTFHTSLFSSARAAWRAKSDPESVRPLARLFWRITLVVVVITGAFIIAAAGYFFFTTQGTINSVDALPIKRNQRLDRDKLDAALSAFEARERAFSERAIPALSPDPSL